MLGKIDSPLNQKLAQVKWGEFKLSELFDITTSKSIDKNKITLVPYGAFDFIGRSRINNGVQGTIDRLSYAPNPKETFSLVQVGESVCLYRNRDWYASQNIFVLNPHVKELSKSQIFITTSINKALSEYASAYTYPTLETIKNITIFLPLSGSKIDCEFIDGFVAELEGQRVAELEGQRVAELQAYLSVTGLSDYTLTEKEKHVIEHLTEIPFKTFKITSIFDIKNTGNILSRDIIENSGSTPYLCASRENNAVSSYITYNEDSLDKGNCVFIGGKTFVVTYQKNDFFSNDSHNLVLYLKKKDFEQQNILLSLVACVDRSLRHKYSWGDSISNKKIKSDVIMLPVNKNEPNYELMATLISAVKKLVIKDVVNYADKKIALTKEVISKS